MMQIYETEGKDARGMLLYLCDLPSGFGKVYTAETSTGVAFASLRSLRAEDFLAAGFRVSTHKQPFGSCEKLVAFIDEREELDMPLHILIGKPFFRHVWRALAKIPYGRTVSYGEIAAMAGAPMLARQAGAAMAANPLPFFLPCHRVIMASGKLGGYGGREDVKRELLRREGVNI